MKNWASLSSNMPSAIDWSHIDDTRKITRQWYTVFHFYFYSNNDPTSPKGPRKQTTEPILGTALFGKNQLQLVEWESVAWLIASYDLSGNNAEFVPVDLIGEKNKVILEYTLFQLQTGNMIWYTLSGFYIPRAIGEGNIQSRSAFNSVAARSS